MPVGGVFLSDYVFLFDLDATITRAEILPEIAVKINNGAADERADREDDGRRDSV